MPTNTPSHHNDFYTQLTKKWEQQSTNPCPQSEITIDNTQEDFYMALAKKWKSQEAQSNAK